VTRRLLEALPEVKHVDAEQPPNLKHTPNSHLPSVDPNERTGWIFMFWEDTSASAMEAHYDKVRELTEHDDVTISKSGFGNWFRCYAVSVDATTRYAIAASPEVKLVESDYMMRTFVQAQSTPIIPRKSAIIPIATAE
jgi:hypothetical protein